MLVFSPTFLQAQPTPRPLEARPAETGVRSEGDISKTVSQKKAVMVAKDVAAVLVFYWARSIAPLSVGVYGIRGKRSLRPATEERDLILMAL